MHYYIICLFVLNFSMAFALNDFDLTVIEQYILDEHKLPDNMQDPLQLKIMKSDSASDKLKDIKFKGESRNNINWEEIDEHEWLSFSAWREKVDEESAGTRDKVALRKVARDLSYSEVMGKVIKCLGRCFNYRGVKRVKAEYLTQLKEGDEFVTLEDSYAWIFLTDGSLLRLSPKSSVTLQEINISKKDFFVILRLNNGYLNFIPRTIMPLKESDTVETDLAFLPLQIKKANREYYALSEYRELEGKNKIEYTLNRNPGYQQQTKHLNDLILANNAFIKNRKSRFYLFTPNFSIEGESNPVNMFYEPSGVGLFSIAQKTEFQENGEKSIDVVVTRRGYNNTDVLTPEWDQWYEVNPNGTQIGQKMDGLNFLNASLAFLKRIPSVLLTREIWIDATMKPLFIEELDERMMAEKFGYRLWNVRDENEDQKRLNFIREYIRRIETTNINSLIKLMKDKALVGFDRSYIQSAMEKHYYALKTYYSKSRSDIFNFSDIEYYLWILKYGKN